MGSAPASAARVYLHTLGCPKNEADSRTIMRRLTAAGVRVVEDPDEATHILINTCGFIRDAKEESIEAILTAQKRYPGRSVVVFGCLVERYHDELAIGIPEVQAWLGVVGPGFEKRLTKIIAEQGSEDPEEGKKSPACGSRSYAYIKISDGCDHECTFCAIPAIKGRYRSASTEEILEEAAACLADGARELILVGQDTTRWKSGRLSLVDLVERLCSDVRTRWLRLMYLQPGGIDSPFLEFMASSEKVCRYLDVPFQHSHSEILRSMGRQGDGESYLALLDEARRLMPDVSTRSTFILGFPGEREKHFRHLLDFVERARFDYAGGFVYSPEEGTRASTLRPRVSSQVGRRRLNLLGATVERIAEQKHRAMIGAEVDVIIDEIGEEEAKAGVMAVGRTRGQAPDVDGVTYVEGHLPKGLAPGDLVRVRINGAVGWDLMGEFCALQPA